MTRKLSPGEGTNQRHGMQNELQFLNRIHLGQIDSVDEDNGTIDVVVLDLGDRITCTIPLSGMSINRTSSSWIRYMPQRGDFVEIAYNHMNQPRCLGYAMLGDNPSAVSDTAANSGKYVPHIGGYKTARLLQEASMKGQKVTDPATGRSVTIGLREFGKLKSGEWDMRSSGGAYIRGSRFGQLTMSCSSEFIVIDKSREEITSRTSMYEWDANNDTYARLGDVKRALVPFSADTAIPGADKEYHLRVTKTVGIVSSPVYDLKTGDVRDDLGLPILGPSPLVYRENITDGTPLEVILRQVTVDSFGNVVVNHGPKTLTVSVSGGPSTTYSSSFATTTIESTAVSRIDAPIVQLGSVAKAVHPSVHGDILLTLLETIATAISGITAATGGAPAAATINTAIAAVTPPGASGLVSAKVLVE